MIAFFGYKRSAQFNMSRQTSRPSTFILYLTRGIHPIYLSCISIAHHSADSDTRASPRFCLCLQIEYLANYQHCIRGSTALQWRNLMQTESQLINSEITGTCLPKCPYGKGISNPLAKKGSSAPCEFPHLFSYSKSGSIKQIKQYMRRWERARERMRVCNRMFMYLLR